MSPFAAAVLANVRPEIREEVAYALELANADTSAPNDRTREDPMTLPEPGVVIDLDGLEKVAKAVFPVSRWMRYSALHGGPDENGCEVGDAEHGHVATPESYELAAYIATFDPPTCLALIERLRALEGGGGEEVTSAQSQPIVSSNGHPEAGGSAAWWLLSRLYRLQAAAQTYFDGYCQDEAADDGPDFTGCSHEQHRDAVELRDALADSSLAETLTAAQRASAATHPADPTRTPLGSPPIREAIPLPSTQPEAEPSGGWSVETAAIRIGEAVFTLPRPNRHHNVMWWLSTLGVRSGLMHDQGFVLSDGCYVDRLTAAHHALQAGQVERLISPPYLYSEDLWDGGADLPSPADIQKLAAPPPPEEPGGEGRSAQSQPIAASNGRPDAQHDDGEG